MRRLTTPVLVLLSASSLFLGACSKDSSDTTAAAETEAVATDAAVETTAAEATEATATEAAATDAAATEAAGSDAASGGALTTFLGAIGAEATPETIACFNTEVPGIESSIEAAMNADYPPQDVFKAMISCAPDAIFGGTAKSIVQKTPEITEEQSKCLAMSISGLLADRSPEDYATLAPADGKDWPQAFKDEIVAGSAECNVDAATLTKVIEAV